MSPNTPNNTDQATLDQIYADKEAAMQKMMELMKMQKVSKHNKRVTKGAFGKVKQKVRM